MSVRRTHALVVSASTTRAPTPVTAELATRAHSPELSAEVRLLGTGVCLSQMKAWLVRNPVKHKCKRLIPSPPPLLHSQPHAPTPPDGCLILTLTSLKVVLQNLANIQIFWKLSVCQENSLFSLLLSYFFWWFIFQPGHRECGFSVWQKLGKASFRITCHSSLHRKEDSELCS